MSAIVREDSRGNITWVKINKGSKALSNAVGGMKNEAKRISVTKKEAPHGKQILKGSKASNLDVRQASFNKTGYFSAAEQKSMEERIQSNVPTEKDGNKSEIVKREKKSSIRSSISSEDTLNLRSSTMTSFSDDFFTKEDFIPEEHLSTFTDLEELQLESSLDIISPPPPNRIMKRESNAKDQTKKVEKADL